MSYKINELKSITKMCNFCPQIVSVIVLNFMFYLLQGTGNFFNYSITVLF